MEAQLLNRIRDVWASKGEVLKSPSQTPVRGGIRHRVPLSLRQLALGVNRSGAGVAVCHPGALKDVKSVLPLVKEKSSRVRRNSDPKEVM
jgi:hypothetical protein